MPTRHSKYPVHPHSGNVTIPRWEYDSLREIARLHKILLAKVEEKMPEVLADFKAASGK